MQGILNGSNYARKIKVFYLYQNKTDISFILQMQRIQQNTVQNSNNFIVVVNQQNSWVQS